MLRITARPRLATTTTKRDVTTNASNASNTRGFGVKVMDFSSKSSRRDALTYVRDGALAMVLSSLTFPSSSHALLQPNDEDDEVFLAKARENRATRVRDEVQKSRASTEDAGLKQDANTSAVQLAVYKLSKSGSAIASGDARSAASELAAGGEWAARAAVAAGDDSGAFEKSVDELRAACASGSDEDAKKAFSNAAKALKKLAGDAKMTEKLRLL